MTGCDDDYDPLAPMPASEAPEEEPAVEDDPLAAPAYGAADDDEPEETGFDDTDGGFSDYDRIVRIWVGRPPHQGAALPGVVPQGARRGWAGIPVPAGIPVVVCAARTGARRVAPEPRGPC